MGNDIRLATLVALLSSWASSHGMQTLRQPGDVPPTETNSIQTEQPLPPFSAMDVDADGSVSEREASAHAGLTALFAELDKNRDGQLSVREYAEAKIRLSK
jgi:hypothetical protein